MRKKDITKELPLEVGKRYKTTFATGEGILTTRIVKIKRPENQKFGFVEWLNHFEGNNDVHRVFGIYDKSPNLGECEISLNIIKPELVKVGEVDVCSKCGHPINER